VVGPLSTILRVGQRVLTTNYIEDQQNPVDYSKSFMVPYYPAANALIKKLKKRFNISTVFSKTETWEIF